MPSFRFINLSQSWVILTLQSSRSKNFINFGIPLRHGEHSTSMMNSMRMTLRVLRIDLKGDGWRSKTRSAELSMTRLKEREFLNLLTLLMITIQESLLRKN